MSAAEDYILSVIDARSPRPGPIPSVLRDFLAGCAGLYDAGLEAYLAAERIGLRRRGRLPSPVISIGNLTVGGTGKTPMTALLCRRLVDRGLRVTILSRGHGGSSQDARIVSTPGGEIVLDSVDAGDEPVLLARLCPGIPVVVGKDRRLSGREALRNWPVDVFVLDDGFQFWQLARDVDIVLLDSKSPFDNGFPLPRGLLREPARHIRRAHIAVITRADRLTPEERTALIGRVHAYAPDMPVHFASHQPVSLIPLHPGAMPVALDRHADAPPAHADPASPVDGSSHSTFSSGSGAMPVALDRHADAPPAHDDPASALDYSSNSTFHIPHSTFSSPVVALSAIAQPASFYRTLESAGCTLARTIDLPDHHRFTPADVDTARAAVEESGAAALVMTEKDAVKWPVDEWKSDVPVYALRIAMSVEDEDAFVDDVAGRAGL